jgi:hypothetical protein
MENTAIKVALFKKIADNNQNYSIVVMNNEAQEIETAENNNYPMILQDIDKEEQVDLKKSNTMERPTES